MAELQAILLAAGGSSRLGRAKQLLTFRGETLVLRAARQLLTLTPSVTVVTGARHGQITQALEGLPVSLSHNERWREGVGSSIAMASQALPEEAQAVLVMLCDQYLLDGADLDRLQNAWRAQPGRITAARWDTAFGAPVIFPRQFFSRLGRLSGDLGARRLLVEERARVQFVEVPNAAVDVDDAADLERLAAADRSGRESG